jgi:hypothetical protein
VLTIGGTTATLFISFYLLWNYAVQAQGRYLFPIFPMVAVLIFSARHLLSERLLRTFILLAFALSLFSSIFTGLMQIET